MRVYFTLVTNNLHDTFSAPKPGEGMGEEIKCKVALIHPDLGIGGAERLVLDVALELSSLGYEVSHTVLSRNLSVTFKLIRALLLSNRL